MYQKTSIRIIWAKLKMDFYVSDNKHNKPMLSAIGGKIDEISAIVQNE